MKNKYSVNVLNVLTTLSYKGIANAWIAENYHQKIDDNFLTILEKKRNKEECLERPLKDDFEYRKEKIKAELDELEDFVDGFVAFGDDNFPLILNKNIKEKSYNLLETNQTNFRKMTAKSSDFPVFLCYKGDFNLLKTKTMNIAVIGLTEPKEEFQTLEETIVSTMIKHNAVIVSGLALGCDCIAHKSALKNNGATIAVLPSTLKNIIPQQNRELANEIVANGGLLISEYHKEVESPLEQTARYVKRDRLQAAFSDMVVLTASYTKEDTQQDKKLDSGSRHAIDKAKEYGIKYAVICDQNLINDEQFHLNKQLIEEVIKQPLNAKNTNNFIDFVNKNNKNFKIFTKNNTEKLTTSFKKFLGAI